MGIALRTEPEADPLPAVIRAPDAARELIRPSRFACRLATAAPLPIAPVLADLPRPGRRRRGHMPPIKRCQCGSKKAIPRLRIRDCVRSARPLCPGVLEINLPPASNWDQLEQIYTLLDDEARKVRLISEKYSFSGNRDATGGGSHIVIGGATVADSPNLRRPDLLRSMVAFWQNHPSLSYLFSGMYVGPTSQYPRVDEARMDALYELEVAFRHLPSTDCPAYVVDGLFRNLLADVTGNTHRAEFCVDKLFPPEGLGLQLGLLELRAFEMPPNVRMGLLQMLLVRALVCMFWKAPFQGSVIPWGTALHDRFMLPHFVRQDFLEVLAQLRGSSLNSKRSGLPHTLNFASPRSVQSLQTEWNSNCAGRSNHGTCWRKRLLPDVRFAMSTRRLSACK